MTHPIKSSIPPQLPPTTEEDVISHLRLLRSRRVGPATYRRMLAEYGTAADALQALPDVARAAGVDDYAICPIGVIRAELQAAKAAGARLLWDNDALYPAALRDISDAPAFLWCLGQTELYQRP